MSDQGLGKLPVLIIVLIIAAVVGYGVYSTQTDQVASVENVPEVAEASVDDITNDLPQPEVIENEVSEDVETVAQNMQDSSDAAANGASMKSFDKDAALNDGTPLPTRAIGDPDAPIYVVEYSSLTCDHCASFHTDTLNKFKEKYVDTGKVYMVFREFPLNKAAVDASMLLRCMPEEKHYDFMTFLFDTQKQWAFVPDYLQKLKMNAKLAGLSDEQIESCLSDEGMELALAESLKIGTEKYGVRSTPSFVVNGGERLITGNQGLPFFEKIIDAMLANQPAE